MKTQKIFAAIGAISLFVLFLTTEIKRDNLEKENKRLENVIDSLQTVKDSIYIK